MHKDRWLPRLVLSLKHDFEGRVQLREVSRSGLELGDDPNLLPKSMILQYAIIEFHVESFGPEINLPCTRRDNQVSVFIYKPEIDQKGRYFRSSFFSARHLRLAQST